MEQIFKKMGNFLNFFRITRARAKNKSLLRDKSGAAALEFALVAAPFFLLTFATIEVGMLFFTSSAVDHSVTTAARMVRTGEVQSSNLTKADFVDVVCDTMNTFGDCRNNVTVEVKNFTDFGSMSASAPVCDESGGNTTPFDPGAAGQVVMVRVCYHYKVMTPGLGNKLVNLSDGKRAVVSTIVFRNEPFDDLLPAAVI